MTEPPKKIVFAGYVRFFGLLRAPPSTAQENKPAAGANMTSKSAALKKLSAS